MKLRLVLLLFALGAGPGTAAEFEISVGGRSNAFDPALLTIQVGDTVTWINRGGTHNVRSINDAAGEFFSGPPAGDSWRFSHTFTAPGQYDYQCDPHQPFMRGSIVVEGSAELGFEINAGIAGAWFDPATSGQGMLFDVKPDSSEFFAAWFTFNDAAGVKEIGSMDQRWFTAFGPYDAGTATLDVTVTSGGVFDDPQPVTNSAGGSVGTLTIEFEGCSAATASYDLPLYGLTGEIPLVRLLPDVFCAATAEAAR
ncbi:MAG: plastocyanin/azurin family copper-binding protein [Pseudomonadota bacterium]